MLQHIESSVFSGFFFQWLDRYLLPIDDPGSRLFGLNLIVAIGFMFFYFGTNFSKVREAIFSKKYWWNRSTRLDYFYYLLNAVLKLALFAPFVKISFWVSFWILKQLLNITGSASSIQPSIFALILFSLGTFIFDDFLRFFHHMIMHKVPFLWKLHRVHHEAHVLTPMTLYRLHPVESVIATARNALSVGVSLGFFLFLFDGDSNMYSWLGTASFGLLFNLLGSNLRHSHIALSFGRLEHIFISPAQHQMHHDRNSRDINYGVSLALWDKIIGSLRLYKGQKMRFGLRKKALSLAQRRQPEIFLAQPLRSSFNKIE
ncbi:MAG: sterol desaturase family protein [Oligoflexia bacterium]|nr:sterol desaturase family protein [Oligoflexia bacterium]